MPEVRYDAGLRALVSAEPWEEIARDLVFTEGPVWHPDGFLLFSDIQGNRIYTWQAGTLAVYREPSSESNGLTLDQNRSLLACEHRGRRVSRERDGTVTAIAERYNGKRLNSPNDLVVRSDGLVYFTDPPYGISDDQRELPFNGVFSVRPGDSPQLLASDFERPNGLAFSPDERTLYVADTARHHVRAFDVATDGSVSAGGVFVETHDEGRPDGMKVDRDGRLYVCAATVQVFASDGALLGGIECPQSPANCAWGEDGSTLFVTARTAVYRTRLSTMGIAPHLR